METTLMPQYRNTLRKALFSRIALNPSYSLRAFARDLGISAPYLSQVLSGKRGLTSKHSKRVFDQLGLPKHEQTLLALEIEKNRFRSEKGRNLVQKKMDIAFQESSARHLSEADFESMSDWYAIALLQLFAIKKAPIQSKALFIVWAAEKINIPEATVQNTLVHLEKLGLVKSKGRGIINIESNVRVSSAGISSASIQKFHRQMIEKASQAIEFQTPDERNLQSAMIPIHSADYSAIEKEILKFRNSLIKKYGKLDSKDADSLYAFNIQLFNLTPQR